MKLINPNFEIWNQEITSDNLMDGVWSHIARCTRVCYQSDNKKTNESDEDFVKRVILAHKPDNSEANHLAMLEHGTIYLKIPIKEYNKKYKKKYFSEK